MAYPATVRERAFALYLQGMNCEQIAEALRPDHPRISANTVRAWSEEQDDHQENWEDRRHSVDRAARRRIEQNAATMRTTTMTRAQTLMSELYNQLTSDAAPKAKSYEGAVFAFKALGEFAIQLDDEQQDRFSPLRAADMILQALNEDPEVRKVLKARWSQVQESLRRKLNDSTRTQEIEVNAS